MSRGKLTAEARRLARIKKIKAHVLALPDSLFPITQKGTAGNAADKVQAFRELVEEGHLELRRGVGYSRVQVPS